MSVPKSLNYPPVCAGGWLRTVQRLETKSLLGWWCTEIRPERRFTFIFLSGEWGVEGKENLVIPGPINLLLS